ncbi:MAG: MFS transporter [Clostridia bacterium]|nr:MFS transporter [Clostridia bacterium]
MLSEKKLKGLALLFTVTYTVSYITRINFSAIISEIEANTQISRTLLSTAVTGSFITYGVGQIISGICGDLFSPKKLVQTGLIISVIMNFLMPFCASPYLMLTVWCVNGFAQAFMWPPIVRIMVSAFSEEQYKKMAVRISWASSYGTIIIYFIAPVLITLLNWKAVFLFSACCGFFMIILWNKYCIHIKDIPQKSLNKENPSQKSARKILLSPVVIAIMVSIILQGMLRDGVATWMPSYIADTYHLGSAVSILTGVVLPLFSILCTQTASFLYRKKFKSPVLCSAIMFLIGTISTVGLYFTSGNNAILSVVCFSLLTGSMHAVSSMLTAMVPPFFKKYGNISTVTGILNACAYVGSGISAFGIAIVSENIGWQFTLLIWCIIAIVGTMICLASIKPWENKFSNNA